MGAPVGPAGTVPASEVEPLALLVAAIVALVVAVLAGRVAWRAWLRRRASAELGVPVPRTVSARRDAACPSPGTLRLAYPRWARAKADGTRDRRTNSLAVVRPPSVLRAGGWRLEDTSPFTVYHLALRLRDAGRPVSLCDEEREKYLRLRDRARDRRCARSADGLVARFHSRPTDFESFCAELYRALGYEAHVTPPSRDGGFDLRLVDPDGRSCIVECKCYARGHSVGRPQVQKLRGANDVEGAERMAFVTTSGFSAEAERYARQAGVELVDGAALTALCDRAWGRAQEADVPEEDARLTDAEIRLRFPADM